jgi:hypothetical protein
MKQARNTTEWLEVPVPEDGPTSVEYGSIISLPGEDPIALHVVQFKHGRVKGFTSREEELDEAILTGASFEADELLRVVKDAVSQMYTLNVDGFNTKQKGERVTYVDTNKVIEALEAELGCVLIESRDTLGKITNKHQALVGSGMCWYNKVKDASEMIRQADAISGVLHRLWKLGLWKLGQQEEKT